MGYFLEEFEDHFQAVQAARESLAVPFSKLLAASVAAIRGGNKIMLFGNGGSAADAQHIATELTIRYIKDRAPIAAIALTTDSSALTAAGNDLGFDEIFARQVAALGKPGDVVIGITTSGTSPNVVAALKTARAMGMVTAAFTGRDGGVMPTLADIPLIVPAQSTRRIQEVHILIGHLLCGALETELGLV
ncbi:D-sedoheptulose 7-phosphate isomerase [Aliidongia dinghuensis]|nr:D-sedoheptulose 7-phosphate isomerase [Aliidongia dinghuensis]